MKARENVANIRKIVESEWSGDAENAFFSSDRIDKYRVLSCPEYECTKRGSKLAYYVLGIDVGRIGCTTEICVFKVTPQTRGASLKSLVMIYTFEEEHFEQQAINIKRLYYKYKARAIAIDAAGLGIGLVDYMIKSQEDTDGSYYPPFGVINDEEGLYKKFRTEDMERDVLFLIKANTPFNTEAHSYVQTQLFSGKIRLLIDENQAKAKLTATKAGQAMDSNRRAEYLKPFTMTTILREQMLRNLTA